MDTWAARHWTMLLVIAAMAVTIGAAVVAAGRLRPESGLRRRIAPAALLFLLQWFVGVVIVLPVAISDTRIEQFAPFFR